METRHANLTVFLFFQIPFLSGTPLSIPCAQKMVIDILGSRLITSVSALIQHDGSVKLDPVSLERWLIETDKKSKLHILPILISGARKRQFFMFNSTEHGIIMLINVKMSTIVGILTFINMINTTS